MSGPFSPETAALLLAALLVAGLVSGFAGGLFGVGGGIVTVPALYALFRAAGAPVETGLKTAIGTSLAIIIVTSLRSLAAHRRSGKVDHALLRAWIPWIAIGAAFGGAAARFAPGELLTIVFAAGALWMARRSLFPGERRETRPREIDLAAARVAAPAGLAAGFFSSLMGVGGGAVGVMAMTAAGRSMHHAVATASGFGIAVAAPGAIGFLLSGLGAEALPWGSAGYVNVPAFAAAGAASALAAPWGAHLAHRLNVELLGRLFGAFIAAAAFYLIFDALIR